MLLISTTSVTSGLGQTCGGWPIRNHQPVHAVSRKDHLGSPRCQLSITQLLEALWTFGLATSPPSKCIAYFQHTYYLARIQGIWYTRQVLRPWRLLGLEYGLQGRRCLRTLTFPTDATFGSVNRPAPRLGPAPNLKSASTIETPPCPAFDTTITSPPRFWILLLRTAGQRGKARACSRPQNPRPTSAATSPTRHSCEVAINSSIREPRLHEVQICKRATYTSPMTDL